MSTIFFEHYADRNSFIGLHCVSWVGYISISSTAVLCTAIALGIAYIALVIRCYVSHIFHSLSLLNNIVLYESLSTVLPCFLVKVISGRLLPCLSLLSHSYSVASVLLSRWAVAIHLVCSLLQILLCVCLLLLLHLCRSSLSLVSFSRFSQCWDLSSRYIRFVCLFSVYRIVLSLPSSPLSISSLSSLSSPLSLSMAILRAACAWDVASKMSPGSVADRIYWCNNCHRVPKRNYHHCDDCGTNRHTQALHLCDSCTAAVVRLQMSGLCLVTEESSRESRTEKESGGEGEEDKERGCVEWEWWLLVIVDHGDWYLCKWLRDERNVERAKRIWCIDREIEQEEEDGMKQEEAKGKE